MIKEIFEHRSIRKFEDRKIDPSTIEDICEAAVRASTCGNMQCYSIIVTQNEEILKQLSPLHFGQVENMNAPCVVTVCADVNRFSQWCKQRGTEPGYDNFLWYINGTIDAMLAAQNMILEAEAKGLGICILGTTLYTAEKQIEILNIPHGVIPITSIVMGYPAEHPELSDRLPTSGVIHYERYSDYDEQSINDLWAEREASELTKTLLEENDKHNLAEIFTQNRYTKTDNVAISKSYFELLKKQGFFNN